MAFNVPVISKTTLSLLPRANPGAFGFKYADDCTIIALVYHDIDHSTDLINQFVRWAGQNRMNSNPTKCKELIMYKRGYTAEAYSSILSIPQTSEVTILGLTFQPNCKFSTHLKEKLCKANKCLFFIRCLRNWEGCIQVEVDHLFSPQFYLYYLCLVCVWGLWIRVNYSSAVFRPMV